MGGGKKPTLRSSLIKKYGENGEEIKIENIFERENIVVEVKKQLWLAGPLISVNLLQQCVEVVSLMFVGHLGELSLSSMATSFASASGFIVMVSRGDPGFYSSGGKASTVCQSLFFLLENYDWIFEGSTISLVFSDLLFLMLLCLEMWSFELIVILSGFLPNPKLETSVLSICLNTSGTIWMIPYGLGGAVSTRVANELGAGYPQAACLTVFVVLVMAIIEGTLGGLVLILIRNIWGYAYSKETEVVKYVASIMPILAVSNFLDGQQCVLSGTARGCGRQKIGAYVNLGSYYLEGIPCAILLAFVFHVGGKGLWYGIICALIVQVLSLFIVTSRTNWEAEAKKATYRVYEEIIPVETVH